MQRVGVGVGALTEAEVVAVARDGAGVELTAEALDAIAASRKVVQRLADDPEPHYGISTGFGALATKHIPPAQRALLQQSLIRSHAAGYGPEVEREVVRALMLLRLSTLATGRTGVRPDTALALAGMLDNGITPVVPEYGSLGCSGDLAPLAHVALALLGEGPVRDADGNAGPGRRRAARARDRSGAARREGGARAHQRHRRHARPVVARLPRPGPAAAHRGPDRGDERRGDARHRRGVRRRPAGAAAAAGAGGGCRKHARAARRLADRRLARRPGLRVRPGRVLDALRPAGGRRGAGHPRARAAHRRIRAGRGG